MEKQTIKKSFTSDEDLEKINLLSKKELTKDEVYTFKLRLCDNDVDRDFQCFTAKTLNELAELFKGKTGIFDHSMRSCDQTARIFDTFVEEKKGEKTALGEPLLVLGAKAYMLKNEKNKDFIDEIEAGIKKEVSVSCSVEKRICSICGKDRRDGGCSHIIGKTYENRLCCEMLDGALDAYEFSFVAVPAQRKAGVVKSFGIAKDDKKKNIERGDNLNRLVKKLDTDSDVTLTKEEARRLCSHISELESAGALAEKYIGSVREEVEKSLFERLEGMDKETIKSVVSVMTLSELKNFSLYFEKSKTTPRAQIMSEGKKENGREYSPFRI